MADEVKTFFEKQITVEKLAWEEFEAILVPRTLKKKEHFLRQGQVCKQLAFIASGSVRVYFMVDGEDITKDFNFENSFCGSLASFSLQQPSRFNVVAMEESKIYAMAKDDLYRLYDKYPSIQKIGRLSIENMFIRKELREASFLLDTAQQRYENLLAQNPLIVNRVPLKYLASYIGIKAETLSRIRGK
jgi:CRP/FNR family transcriptional regulator, anaerobic regulatory protein